MHRSMQHSWVHNILTITDRCRVAWNGSRTRLVLNLASVSFIIYCGIPSVDPEEIYPNREWYRIAQDAECAVLNTLINKYPLVLKVFFSQVMFMTFHRDTCKIWCGKRNILFLKIKYLQQNKLQVRFPKRYINVSADV